VSVSSSSCSSSLSLPSFLPFRIPHCVLFWRFFLRAHSRALPLPHFSFGAKHLSHRHTPLCKTRFVYLCSSSLHSILLSHDIISVCVVCVFLWLRLVSLCLWLCSVEVCNPILPLNLSLQVCFFFLLVEPSLVFNSFFQFCRRSVACSLELVFWTCKSWRLPT
jgi:hypothetical protein